jgi:release factor glutamine methyltransferase
VAETLGSLLVEAAAALSADGFGEPRRHARRLLASALAISQADLFGNPDRPLDEWQIGRIRMMLDRMLKREPLTRILGRREFWGLDFSLSSETLDPRPETETLVEAVLQRNRDRAAPLRFLDLGTGTGCLLLALLCEFPAAIGIGVDIAAGAVSTACRNAARLGFAGRALFFRGNWVEAVSGKFDAIVTNPPYIATDALAVLPREVACHDPWRALDGGEDGLGAYRALAGALPALLAPEGIVAAEVGVGQASLVATILEAGGLVFDAIKEDLGGIARCVIMRQEPRGSRRTAVARRQKKVGMHRGPV